MAQPISMHKVLPSFAPNIKDPFGGRAGKGWSKTLVRPATDPLHPVNRDFVSISQVIIFGLANGWYRNLIKCNDFS
jgi:hypothetical protein